MKFIDTHSHMYAAQFDDDRDACVQKAIQSGVEKIILPNIDAESVEGLNSMLQQYPQNCYGLMGIHPTSVKDNYKEQLELVFEALETNKYIGVGEIGIDLYWDKTHLVEQIDAFKQQVNYAVEKNLPFVIHARDSFEEVFQALDEIGNSQYKGIFHAFTGTIEDARRAIDLGLLIGIGGIVTFKNSGLAKVVAQIDLNHLVLETDSPYLAPTPYRGKRNESSYVELIARKIAELKGFSIEEVARITTRNAQKMFNL